MHAHIHMYVYIYARVYTGLAHIHTYTHIILTEFENSGSETQSLPTL